MESRITLELKNISNYKTRQDKVGKIFYNISTVRLTGQGDHVRRSGNSYSPVKSELINMTRAWDKEKF